MRCMNYVTASAKYKEITIKKLSIWFICFVFQFVIYIVYITITINKIISYFNKKISYYCLNCPFHLREYLQVCNICF